MPKCEICGKNVKEVFKCKECGAKFCKNDGNVDALLCRYCEEEMQEMIREEREVMDDIQEIEQETD
ncbi:MAG: hypothetical protein J7K22_01915 [Nanoarchaeota archaeon]|nr:hypothetical protein [Nanoarchaeota archaeon]